MYNDKGNTKYLKLLKQNYSSSQDVIREIVNLSAIINLPKGTEFFLSDIHGEYEAFLHIMNNCSGVIKEKVDLIFKDTISDYDRQELCPLIYYPREKMALLAEQGKIDSDWYAMTLNQLILVAKLLSSKYTRSKVRKALPEEYAYIIDELLHAQEDEDANQVRYHKQILKTIIDLEDADEFIIALSALIKRLAVDHLHIVGDVFDRGGSADKILDLLYDYHSLDIEWGNHDILWMGAACGNDACICNVIRNNLKYNNVEILENAYGISLRQLMLFGMKTYGIEDGIEAARAAITVMLFKLEGQLILAHPEYEMGNRLMLDRLDELQDVGVDRKRFPTVDDERPYALSDEETVIMRKLHRQFVTGQRLHKHVRFLYDKGGMYNVYNGNLLYHGCVPVDSNGAFDKLYIDGEFYHGRALLDKCDEKARAAYVDNPYKDDVDFMCFGRENGLNMILMKWLTADARLVSVNSKVIFLDEEDNPHEFTVSDYASGRGEGTVGALGMDLWGLRILLLGDLSVFKNHIMTAVRIYTTDGYYDYKIKKSAAEKARKAYRLFEKEIQKGKL